MLKYTAIQNTSADINRLIISNIADYVHINELLQRFIGDPSAESADLLEQQFKKVASGLDSVGMSIAELANIVMQESDEIEITQDENGQRLL